MDTKNDWLDNTINNWLTAAAARGGIRSDETTRAYRNDMRRWATQFADPTTGTVTAESFTTEAVEKAMVAFNTEGLAATTRRRLLSTLSGFTKWAHRRGHIPIDPCDDDFKVTITPGPRRLPVSFTDTELAAIHTAICVPPTKAWSRWTELDRALFAVLIGAGLRSSEVCDLTTQDILEQKPASLNVIGKGGKQRRVPIDNNTLKVLRSWLWVREHHTPASRTTNRLFVNRNGKPITTHALHGRVLSWLKQAGVAKPDGAVTHAFRHTYAHRLAMAHTPIPVIQAALGHSSIATTSIYVAATTTDIADAITATQPGTALTGKTGNDDKKQP